MESLYVRIPSLSKDAKTTTRFGDLGTPSSFSAPTTEIDLQGSAKMAGEIVQALCGLPTSLLVDVDVHVVSCLL